MQDITEIADKGCMRIIVVSEKRVFIDREKPPYYNITCITYKPARLHN